MLRSIGLVTCLAVLFVACEGGTGGGSNGPGQSSIVVAMTPAPQAGTVSYDYPGFSFVASGGLPPYSWKVTKGAVPPGLVLGVDGSLTGTPTVAGSFEFTVTATDSAQGRGTDSQHFTVTINTPGPLVLTPGQTPPAGVHDTRY